MKKKHNFKQMISTGFSLLLGLLGGLSIGMISDRFTDGSLFEFFLSILLGLMAFYLQLILHELGHWVFGLLSGYTFSSFRIGSITLIKTEQGYAWKRKTLVGTGGQCLLAPPAYKHGTYPYHLYHMGGSISNLGCSIVFFAMVVSLPNLGLCSAFLLELAVLGIILGLTNGIPMSVNLLDNDGMNALHLDKDPIAMKAMWLQLTINDRLTKGQRLKEMPKEWFTLPDNANKHNPIVSTISVFAENRAMDQHDFIKAQQLQKDLLSSAYTISGIYEHLLKLDAVFLNIYEHGPKADVSYLEEKNTQRFISSMSSFPSVLRTQYALAKYYLCDDVQANKVLKKFYKVVQSYPEQADAASETSLIDAIDAKNK